MRVLLIGKGGREHALAWKIRRSSLVSELLLWPGNPAMNQLGTPLDLPESAPLSQVVQAAVAAKVDLVIPGPEAPLESGLADLCAEVELPIFGPLKAAAALESSKAFAKDVMRAAGIPTAAYEVVESESQARQLAYQWLKQKGGVVLKASGLAGGKGVFVCTTDAQVEEGLRRLYGPGMRDAAKSLVVEELMKGRECSYFTLIGPDGPASTGASPTGLGFAVDYKRLEDDDKGPNTGGMGCYAPVPWLPSDAERTIVSRVVTPLLAELSKRNIPYCGCLYVGIMWTPDAGPKVVEFNVRLGDPEAEVLAVYDDRDWLALMASKAGLAVPEAALDAATAKISHGEHAVAVVMASAGYPFGEGEREPAPLDPALFALNDTPVKAFAASIAAAGPQQLRTATGRVLILATRARGFDAARTKVYAKVDELARTWPGCRFRRDIGRHTS